MLNRQHDVDADHREYCQCYGPNYSALSCHSVEPNMIGEE